MSVARIANRYAKSLIELAQEQQQLEEVRKEVGQLQQLMAQQRDLELLVKSPIVSEDKKEKVFKSLFEGNLNPMLMSFLLIIIRKKREQYLPEIFDAFVAQYNTLKEITPVRLITAVPVDTSFEEQVIRLMQEEFHKKTIDLTTTVEETLVGGFVLEFEDKRLDASVSHQLAALRKEFHKNIQFKNL